MHGPFPSLGPLCSAPAGVGGAAVLAVFPQVHRFFCCGCEESPVWHQQNPPNAPYATHCVVEKQEEQGLMLCSYWYLREGPMETKSLSPLLVTWGVSQGL